MSNTYLRLFFLDLVMFARSLAFPQTCILEVSTKKSLLILNKVFSFDMVGSFLTCKNGHCLIFEHRTLLTFSKIEHGMVIIGINFPIFVVDVSSLS
jgi:hypothetical protein